MTYQSEVAKEYLRNAFHSGALDITRNFETVRGFCQIFAGEMEALIAIEHCRFLTAAEGDRLMAIAAPTEDTLRHYVAWVQRTDG